MKDRIDKAVRKLDKGFYDRLFTKDIYLPGGPYSRQDLIEIGVGNISAAIRLSAVCRRYQIDNISDLKRYDPLSLAGVRGVGMTQLYVAMVLLDEHGTPPSVWWGWDKDKAATFATYKDRKLRRRKARGTTD